MCAKPSAPWTSSLKATVEYLKTRKQFGRAIGSFQTLQHRAADMSSPSAGRKHVDVATMAADSILTAKERATAVRRKSAGRQIGKIQSASNRPAYGGIA